MSWHVGVGMLQPGFSILENEVALHYFTNEASFCSKTALTSKRFALFLLKTRYRFGSTSFQWSSPHVRKRGWRIGFALDTGGLLGNDGQDGLNNGDNSGIGGTRLGRIVSAGGKQLLAKLNSARKNFPMKVFLLLLGFYTANALATILGQTGDWDVLVAGVVVAAIEGIGMLMYRKPSSLSTQRLQSLVVMINYWKAGVCLGLFVDAFKLGS